MTSNFIIVDITHCAIPQNSKDIVDLSNNLHYLPALLDCRWILVSLMSIFMISWA